MHSLFCQLPNCNFFTQHVISLWRDTSSELWTPVHSFTFILPSTASTVYFPQVLFYFTANKHLFPHYTFNPLFSANQWDWQPHCKLGQRILVVLCAGSTLMLAPKLPRAINYFLVPYQKPVSNNLQKWFLSPTGRLNFGFIMRENLLLCSSYLPLGVSQRVLWDISVCCRLKHATGVSWCDGRCRGSLVQRGTSKGVAVVFPLLSAMSSETKGQWCRELWWRERLGRARTCHITF
jgi:hypothetical protein